jgi:hypothetical protein
MGFADFPAITRPLISGTDEMPTTSTYRGSRKHKDWRPGGGYGTICPNWTHRTPTGGFGGDEHAHRWAETEAHSLFSESEVNSEEPGKRFATRNGIAFVALQTEDGTWHGFPIPWNDVPEPLVTMWRKAKKVTNRQIKDYKPETKHDIRWALKSDSD